MAGVLARTDQQRGVWKAPAGTETILHGVQGIEQTLTQPEMGQLTNLGINPIRQTSPSQFVAWGARTLSSNSEWQYLPVRRLALFRESSIQQGLGWVVDEPNDEPLWGIVDIMIGFASLKPPEFIILKIQQRANLSPQCDLLFTGFAESHCFLNARVNRKCMSKPTQNLGANLNRIAYR